MFCVWCVGVSVYVCDWGCVGSVCLCDCVGGLVCVDGLGCMNVLII